MKKVKTIKLVRVYVTSDGQWEVHKQKDKKWYVVNPETHLTDFGPFDTLTEVKNFFNQCRNS